MVKRAHEMMNVRKNNCFHFYSDRKSKEKISNLMYWEDYAGNDI